ncbi:hypothetical protein [Lactobacillus pasteurii]|uniref:DUF1269 domain-containing family protein n=1 Tax=Lactobacillus pasteurii DSM 23907 = CRBIP 24.76 TaxID=1423790 RepID=I7KLB8_9LACO|nr:hypothetical protein [Lactobacillus pasteurii]TDG76096.1 hypothetical protein C5L33_001654 [Lactobacillus pasteurii]CCI85269.1 Putative uncharacterized protein [Lactobacillus pasteurii DSM 23907 = CRBIP 24.76]
MSKFSHFLLGAVVGAAVGFVAGSVLVDDDQLDDVKKKIKDNDHLQDLKKKYDNGTEIVKNQLASFPKSVDDDTELKDFDDIVIDDSKESQDTTSEVENSSADDLSHAEKDDETENHDQTEEQN